MRDNAEAELDEEKEVPGQATAKDTPHLIRPIGTTKKPKSSGTTLKPIPFLFN